MQGHSTAGAPGMVGTYGVLTSLQIPEEWWMYEFKVNMCSRQDAHDWEKCPYAHPGEKALRRHPRRYQSKHCPYTRAKKVCPAGDNCTCAHSLFEYWLHPDRFRTCFCSKGAACDRPMCFFAHSEYDLRVVGPSVSAPLVSPGTDTPPALSPLTSADITLDAGLLATLLALQPPITTPTAAAAAVAPQQLARSPQGSPPVQLSPIRVAPAVQPSQLAGAADAASLGVIDRLLASANLISPGGGGGGGGGGTSGTGSSYHSSAPPSSSGGNTSRSVSPGLAPLSPGAALAAAAAGGYAVLPGMESDAVLSLSSWQREQAGLPSATTLLAATPAMAVPAAAGPGAPGVGMVRSNSWVDEHAAVRQAQATSPPCEAYSEGFLAGSGVALVPGAPPLSRGLSPAAATPRPDLLGPAAAPAVQDTRATPLGMGSVPQLAGPTLAAPTLPCWRGGVVPAGVAPAAAAAAAGGGYVLTGSPGGLSPLTSPCHPLSAAPSGGATSMGMARRRASASAALGPLYSSGAGSSLGAPLLPLGQGPSGQLPSTGSSRRMVMGGTPLAGAADLGTAPSARAQAVVRSLVSQLDAGELTQVVSMLRDLLGV